MLEELHVRDLALIDEAWLSFGPGMTVLTGETGAGKTVLVGAVKLLLGERGDQTLVRSGASEAIVEGRFALDDREILARRRVGADGRSRCVLDGEMSTVGGLSEALGALVDLHGQHDHQALLSPSRHVTYLDAYMGDKPAAILDSYRAAFDAHANAVAEAVALGAALEDRERRASLLSSVVSEVDAVAPRLGEDDELEARLPALRHAARLTEAAARAHLALAGEDERGGAESSLEVAMAALRKVRGVDPRLDKIADECEMASTVLGSVRVALGDYAEALEHEPRTLDDMETRLAALSLLKRKYGPTLEDVLAERERAADSLSELDSGEQRMAEANARVDESETALRSAGAALNVARKETAVRLAEDVTSVVGDLSLPGAAFEVAFEGLPFESWTREGPHRTEFLFASAASGQPRPLAKIASGGEMSRVMLALKVALGSADPVPILVFDEVDAGIGGATAHAVGRLLAQLAARHQVLVVTHLAQVAAYADAHYVVRRADLEDETHTSVLVLDGEERLAEIARMLSGRDTEVSITHARELVDSAREALSAPRGSAR